MTAPTVSRAPAAMWKPYQIYLVAVLLAVGICSYLDRSIMALLQEVIKHDLSLTDLDMGLISGPAFVLFHSFVGVPVARFADRTHRPRLLSAAIVFWSAATALCGVAGNFIQLGLCRMGVGMGEGGCNPISHALVAENFSVRQRGFAMAALSMGAPLGGILAPLIAGSIAYYWGWRAAFISVGLPGLLLAALVWLTIKEPRAPRTADSPPRRTFAQDLGWILKNRAFVMVFIAGAFNGIGIQGTLIFTSSFVMRTYHLNVLQAGGVLGLRGLMGLIGTFIGGYLADRFSDPNGRSYVLVPALGALLCFFFYLGAFSAATWPMAIGFLLAANVSTELKAGPNLAAVQNMVPNHMRATAAALFFLAATVIGTGVGAALVGWISDMAATHAFPAALGDYASLCRGGHAAPRAAEPLATACKTAAAGGLKLALMSISTVFLGAAASFWLASRTIQVNTD